MGNGVELVTPGLSYFPPLTPSVLSFRPTSDSQG